MASAKSFLSRFNEIKTLPHIAIRLSKMISDNSSTMDDFEEVIRLDPTLVARLLKLVNSSYYGLRDKICSISDTITFIGIDSLRNMVVIEALKSIFKMESGKTGFSREGLWLHCSAVSLCSQMISERIFGKTGENAFLCGILHDIGLIVENQVEPELLLRVCEACGDDKLQLTGVEDSIFQTNHCEIGELLAREWNLPMEVRHGIRDHHLFQENIEPSSLAGIIQTAEYITSRMDYRSIPGMQTPLAPSLLRYIRDNVDEFRIIIKDMPHEFKRANSIYTLSAE